MLEFLENNYRRFHKKEYLDSDPLLFVHRYADPLDREMVAFISSALAYGRVKLIKDSLEKLLTPMGASPSAWLHDFHPEKQKDLYTGFKHRFNDEKDVLLLFHFLSQILRSSGSIEKFVASRLSGNSDPGAGDVLQALVDGVRELDCSWAYPGESRLPRKAGVRWFFSDPALGSACKRLNLFLRWMVRSDELDPGGWTLIGAEKLIMPMDVHVGRVSILTGLTSRKTISWKTAEEVTGSVARYFPEDPLKFDFSLSRIGILEQCNGLYKTERCEKCELLPVCTVSSEKPS